MSCIVIYERMVKLDLIISFCYIKFFGAIDVGTGVGGVRSPPPPFFSNLNIYVTITIILISLVNVSNTSSPPLSLCFRRHWEQYTYTYILVLTDIFHLPFHLLSLDMKSIGTSLARCICTHFRKSFFFTLHYCEAKFAVKYFNVYFISNRAALRKLKIDLAKISQPRLISSMASKDRGRALVSYYF